MAGGSVTILLAEDDDGVRGFIRHALESSGYKVLEAKNGDEAIHLAEQHSEIDLFICDVVMPGIDGQPLANKLIALRPGIKGFFVSGYFADFVGKHGVSEFLQKPFSHSALIQKVQEILGQDYK